MLQSVSIWVVIPRQMDNPSSCITPRNGTLAHQTVDGNGTLELSRANVLLASSPPNKVVLNVFAYIEIVATIADTGGTVRSRARAPGVASPLVK